MSIRGGRDSDMAGVLGRDLDTRVRFRATSPDTSGILGPFFAIIESLSVPIPPENAVIVQKLPENVVVVEKPPENATAVRKWPKNAVGVRFLPEN